MTGIPQLHQVGMVPNGEPLMIGLEASIPDSYTQCTNTACNLKLKWFDGTNFQYNSDLAPIVETNGKNA